MGSVEKSLEEIEGIISAYERDCLAICRRLNSPDVTASVQKFLEIAHQSHFENLGDKIKVFSDMRQALYMTEEMQDVGVLGEIKKIIKEERKNV